jgi:hypothetical protein
VLRHITRQYVDQGVIDGSAFHLKPREKGLSVEWQERAGDLPLPQQIAVIRATMRREVKASHLFARLHVETTKTQVGQPFPQNGVPAVILAFKHVPLPAEGGKAENPHHSEIHGLPAKGDDSVPEYLVDWVGDRIARSIVECYDRDGRSTACINGELRTTR